MLSNMQSQHLISQSFILQTEQQQQYSKCVVISLSDASNKKHTTKLLTNKKVFEIPITYWHSSTLQHIKTSLESFSSNINTWHSCCRKNYSHQLLVFLTASKINLLLSAVQWFTRLPFFCILKVIFNCKCVFVACK